MIAETLTPSTNGRNFTYGGRKEMGQAAPVSPLSRRGQVFIDATAGLRTQPAHTTESAITVNDVLQIGRQQAGLGRDYSSPGEHNPLKEVPLDRSDRVAERAKQIAASIRANAGTEVTAITTDSEPLRDKLEGHLTTVEAAFQVNEVPVFNGMQEAVLFDADAQSTTSTGMENRGNKITLRTLEDDNGIVDVFTRHASTARTR